MNNQKFLFQQEFHIFRSKITLENIYIFKDSHGSLIFIKFNLMLHPLIYLKKKCFYVIHLLESESYNYLNIIVELH